MNVVTKRIYDQPGHNDGTRVLVDRVWPRGVRKEDAQLDDWVKEVAPSTELRKWFGHDPDQFDEFADRYRRELDTGEGQEAVRRLKEAVTGNRLTLLTATKDMEHSHVVILADVMGQ